MFVQRDRLHYTTDIDLRSKRVWKALPAEIDKVAITSPTPPADANTWFVAVTDKREAMLTSTVQFQP